MLGLSYTNLPSVPWTLQNHSHLSPTSRPPPGHPLFSPSGMCFPIDLHASSFSSFKFQLKCHLLQDPSCPSPLPWDKSTRIQSEIIPLLRGNAETTFQSFDVKMQVNFLVSCHKSKKHPSMITLKLTWGYLTMGLTLMGESESCFWSEQGQESCSLDVPTQQWRSLIQRHLGWERLVKEVCGTFSG